MTAFTIAIARNMGLPKEQIDTIARGAFLHDIGKMAIPDNILNKPGKLTPTSSVSCGNTAILATELVHRDSGS